MAARYYLRSFEFLGFEGSFGLSHFRGQLTPVGIDSVRVVADNLGVESVRIGSVSFGVSALLSWMSEGGFYLEWVPIGLQFAQVVSLSNSSQNGAMNAALRRDIQSLRIFGVANVRIGLYF